MSDSREQDVQNDKERYERKGQQLAAIGAFFAGTAVALGAFGAHGLKKVLSEAALTVYRTGVEYQMYHGLALFALGLGIRVLSYQVGTPTLLKRLNTAAIFLIIGTLFFSGTLYIYTLAGVRLAAMITPVGGVSFLIGWALIVIALIQNRRSS